MRIGTVLHAATLILSGCASGFGVPAATEPTTPNPAVPVSSAESEEMKQYGLKLDAAEAAAERAMATAGADATPELKNVVAQVTKHVAEGRRLLRKKVHATFTDAERANIRTNVWAAEDHAKSAEQLAAKIVAETGKAKAKAKKSALTTAYEDAKATCKQDMTGCEKACAADGSSDLCVALALATAEGVAGGAADFVRAHALLKKGCALANKNACLAVKSMEKVANDCDELDLCSHLCDAALSSGCTNAGELLRDVKPKDLAKAAAFFKRGCDLGDPAACNDLGAAYLLGEGVVRDTKVAETHFKKACDGFQAKVDANPGADAIWLPRRDVACQNAFGTACVNKVQIASMRRPEVDAVCKKKALPPIAWSTSDGTDSDAPCMNAMMNRGCQQVMGTKAYCCPAK